MRKRWLSALPSSLKASQPLLEPNSSASITAFGVRQGSQNGRLKARSSASVCAHDTRAAQRPGAAAPLHEARTPLAAAAGRRPRCMNRTVYDLDDPAGEIIDAHTNEAGDLFGCNVVGRVPGYCALVLGTRRASTWRRVGGPPPRPRGQRRAHRRRAPGPRSGARRRTRSSPRRSPPATRTLNPPSRSTGAAQRRAARRVCSPTVAVLATRRATSTAWAQRHLAASWSWKVCSSAAGSCRGGSTGR